MIEKVLREQLVDTCQAILENDYVWMGGEATDEDMEVLNELLDDMRHLLWVLRVEQVHDL